MARQAASLKPPKALQQQTAIPVGRRNSLRRELTAKALPRSRTPPIRMRCAGTSLGGPLPASQPMHSCRWDIRLKRKVLQRAPRWDGVAPLSQGQQWLHIVADGADRDGSEISAIEAALVVGRSDPKEARLNNVLA